MLKKIGKEKKVLLNQNFRLKYGTVDANNLKEIYFEILSWAQPKNHEDDYKRSASYLKKIAYSAVYDNLNRNIFKDEYIVDLDLRTSGMGVDRRSFMYLEVTLFLKESLCFKSKKIENNINKLLMEVTSKLENNKFSFKSKKNG